MWPVLRSSGALAVRGVLAILFGMLVLVLPESALFALVFLFGAYALADALFALTTAFDRNHRYNRTWLFVEAAAGIVAGAVAFIRPNLTAFALIYVIAAWAAVTGSFRIAAAIRLRKEIRGEGLLILSGMASLIISAALFLRPFLTALAALWVLGFFSVMIGGILIYLAIRVRDIEHRARHSPEQRRAA